MNSKSAYPQYPSLAFRASSILNEAFLNLGRSAVRGQRDIGITNNHKISRLIHLRSFSRDVVESEKIAPRQWQFRQWVAQSKAIKEIAEPVKKSGKGKHHYSH